MNRDHFWLTDEQFAKLRPHLFTDTRGKLRVDDRRVISSTIHVIKSGGRWVDAPAVSVALIPFGDAVLSQDRIAPAPVQSSPIRSSLESVGQLSDDLLISLPAVAR